MEIFPPHVRQRGMIGVMLAAVIAMLGFALVAPFAVAGWSSPLPTPLPPVYYPSSLEVVQPMGSREGLVETTAVHQQDGDFTFDLLSIPINEVLHVEITCVFPPKFDAARVACAGYTNHVKIPHAGEYVRVTGPLVRDLVHKAEFPTLEIHPAGIVMGRIRHDRGRTLKRRHRSAAVGPVAFVSLAGRQ